MNETPKPKASAGFDPIEFTCAKPLATPAELAVGFGQLIDSMCDLSNASVERVVTPGLTSITISWAASSLPSATWRRDVEEQLKAFAACAGVQVRFRQH